MRKHSCAAIIIQDYRILLVKRRKEPFKDSWICPGGKGRNKESPIETVVRETLEEVNLTFKPTTLFQYQHTEERDYYKYLGGYRGEVKVNSRNEIYEYGWFTYPQTKELTLGFDFEGLIGELYSKNLIK